MKISSALLLLVFCGGFGWVLGSFTKPLPLEQDAAPQNTLSSNHSVSAESPPSAQGSGSGAVADFARFGTDAKEANDLESRVFDTLERLPVTELGNVILGLASSTDRRINYLERHVFIYWVGRDLTSAREWLIKLPEEKRLNYSGDLARIWGKKEPDLFLDWTESLAPSLKPSIQKQALAGLIEAAADRIPDRILAAILSFPANEQHQIQILFSRWGKSEPQRAAERARQLPSGRAQSEAVKAAISAWAEKDAAAASRFLASIDDPVLAQKAQSSLISGLADKDPAAAMAALSELPLTVESKNAISSVVTKWTRKNPEGALEWADQLSDADTARKAYATIFETLSWQDLEKATAAVTTRSEKLVHNQEALKSLMGAAKRRHGLAKIDTYIATLPQDIQTCAAVAVTKYLAGSEATELQSWIERQPEGEARQAGMEKLTGSKFQTDPAATLQWVQALPAGTSRDIAAGEFINQTFYQSADRGVDMARLLQPAATAENTIEERMQRWLFHNEKSASEWIKKTDKLSADQKRNLLER